MTEYRIRITNRDGDDFVLHFNGDAASLEELVATTETLRKSSDAEDVELHVG